MVPEQAWARRLFRDDVNQNIHASESLQALINYTLTIRFL
jgi:hypothetical protein